MCRPSSSRLRRCSFVNLYRAGTCSALGGPRLPSPLPLPIVLTVYHPPVPLDPTNLVSIMAMGKHPSWLRSNIDSLFGRHVAQRCSPAPLCLSACIPPRRPPPLQVELGRRWCSWTLSAVAADEWAPIIHQCLSCSSLILWTLCDSLDAGVIYPLIVTLSVDLPSWAGQCTWRWDSMESVLPVLFYPASWPALGLSMVQRAWFTLPQ
ncbi:hypothetical protein CALCODRAFT_80636 [Calocera cornea HHB12733]|uniref:Uncharacterized protein n=1 Tax=Calocera cornea HHB12733 TaxID=1353952 RepID=A0A165DE98_9BASI|nr:hypothetical protein CALCODRAFT_80636 [Calocera cornea HHB12733]